MHTSDYEPYKFHHNYGFEGDIIVVRKRSKTEYDETRTTSEAILALAKEDHPPDQRIPFEGTDGNTGKKSKFTVPFEIICDFVADSYVRMLLTEKVEKMSTEQLLALFHGQKTFSEVMEEIPNDYD
jgi:hypothetical protein